MPTDATGPTVPTPDLPEVLRRLSVMEQKIDWIAHRVAQGATAEADDGRAPDAQTDDPFARPEVRAATHRAYAHAVAGAAGPAVPGAVMPGGAVPGGAVPGGATPQDGRDVPLPRGASEDRRPTTSAPAGSAPSGWSGSQPQQTPPVPDPVPTVALAPGGPVVPSAGPVVSPGPMARPAPQVPAGAPPVSATPSSWDRTLREGNVGRYLLSGAAALLILLAAVTLLALVWSSIPDGVKVGALGLLAVGLVAGGTALHQARPSQRVAAATLTSTGGALGYVAVIGAVLLPLGVPVLGAFGLLALWGVLLLVVAQRTEQVLTAVISSVGAMVTTGFASWFVAFRGGDPVSTWSAVTVYLVVLAVLASALTHRGGPRMRDTAPVLAAEAASCFTVLVVPDRLLGVDPSWLGILLGLAPVVVLLVQVVEAAPAVHARGVLVAGVLDLALAVLATELVLLRLGTVALSPTTSQGLALLLLLFVGTGLLLPRGNEVFRGNALLAALVLTGLAALVACGVDIRLALLAVIALVPATLGSARSGNGAAVLAGPVAGTGLVLLPRADATGDASVVAAAIVSVVLAVLAERTLASARSHSGRGTTLGADAGSGDPVLRAQASPRDVLMVTAVWLTGIALGLTVPTGLTGLLADLDAVGANDVLPLGALLISAATAALSLLGLTAGARTPSELLTGALAGRLAGVERDADGVRVTPTVPVLGAVGSALLGLLALIDLAVADARGDIVWAAILVVVAVGLAALATRALLPWGRLAGVTLSLAGLDSVVAWWSVSVLTGTGATSVLMTIVVLVTGACCVVAGFGLRATILRHYGLVLVLVSVLKLALLDVGAQSSIARVLALLVAGLICFGLSLAYNRAADDLGTPRDQGGAPQAPAGAAWPGVPAPQTDPSRRGPAAYRPPAVPPATPTAWPPPADRPEGDERFRPPSS